MKTPSRRASNSEPTALHAEADTLKRLQAKTAAELAACLVHRCELLAI